MFENHYKLFLHVYYYIACIILILYISINIAAAEVRINVAQSLVNATEGENDTLQVCVELSAVSLAAIGTDDLVVYLTVQSGTAGLSWSVLNIV